MQYWVKIVNTAKITVPKSINLPFVDFISSQCRFNFSVHSPKSSPWASAQSWDY